MSGPFYPPEATGRGEPDAALLSLLRWLEDEAFDFVTPTPATHARVLARRPAAYGRDARDVLGWSLPFRAADLPARLVEALEAGQVLSRQDGELRSQIRVSRLRGRLFIHSAYPTEAREAVFFGPDSYRFADFVTRSVGPDFRGRAADVGGGCGAGAIALADHAPGAEVVLTDINAQALRFARIAAQHAGLSIETIAADGLAGAPPRLDLVIANPPYMAASEQTYRDGGGLQGAGLSVDWARAALDRLAPDGRMVLYSGSAIRHGGADRLLGALVEVCRQAGARLDYQEIDPDVFGEELAKPAYGEIERIAAIGCVITAADGGA